MENAFEQMRRSVILYGQSGAPELEKEARKFQALAEKNAAEAKDEDSGRGPPANA